MVHRRASAIDLVKKIGSPSYLIAGMMLLVVGAAGLLMMSQFRSTVTLYLGDGTFYARVAASQAERENGLSGVESLNSRDALILVFPSDDRWGISMKNTEVSVDIIWLDKDRKVIYIVKNVSPDDTAVFVPNSPARYVIEVAAGSVDSQNIKVGGAVVFEIAQEGAN